jgi:cytochrome o ubiquinol oxidase subunit 1
MWLPAVGTFAAVLAAVIIHSFNYDRDYSVPADVVRHTEELRTLELARHV